MSWSAAGFELLAESPADGVTVVRVAPESPFFAGHFPGEPVLPAVAQLVLLAEILEQRVGGSSRITAIDSLRLSRTVGPGDRLRVVLRIAHDSDQARFRIDRDGDRITEGVLRWCQTTVI